MRLLSKYTKETILALWLVVNLVVAISGQTLAVLNALFATFYFVYVAYST